MKGLAILAAAMSAMFAVTLAQADPLPKSQTTPTVEKAPDIKPEVKPVDWTKVTEESSVLIVDGEKGGTGTYIGPNLVLTAAHLLQGDPVIINHDGVTAPARIQYVNETLDVALLIVLNAKKYESTLKLNCNSLEPLDEFKWVGNPVGFRKNWGKGYVSSTEYMGSPWLLPVAATFNHGDSGAGLVNEDHEVIGIVIGFAGGDPSPNGLILPASNFCGIIATLFGR